MKHLLYSFVIFCAVLACRSERTRLLKSIDGTWQVTSLSYTGNARTDSTASPTNTSLTFDACAKDNNQSGPGNCTGRYTMGTRSYEFTYQVLDNKKLGILIRGQADRTFDWREFETIARSYDIVTLSDDALVITSPVTERNFKSVRITAKR